jgi:hypothetical protein
MNVNFVSYVPFISCKGQFQSKLRDKNELPQVQQLNKIIADYESTCYDVIVMIVNDQYCSLNKLNEDIVAASNKAQKYLYLAVNKFLVYSTQDITITDSDYDYRLVEYCRDTISKTFTLLEYTIRPDDNGSLGNFVHPVTTMLFKRNE